LSGLQVEYKKLRNERDQLQNRKRTVQWHISTGVTSKEATLQVHRLTASKKAVATNKQASAVTVKGNHAQDVRQRREFKECNAGPLIFIPCTVFTLKRNKGFKICGTTSQGRTQGELGLGLKPPLELDILQNFITCAKEINCFRILFAC